MPGKIYSIIVMLVLLFTVAGCGSRPSGNVAGNVPEPASNIGPNIDFSEVEWITKAGGLPGSKWKVLFPQRDPDAIRKFVALVNSANETVYDSRDYGGGKAIGYPVGIIVKLKNGHTVTVEPLFKVTTRELKGGIESTAAVYPDRALLRIEGEAKEIQCALLSEEMARYLLYDSDKDIQKVEEFLVVPDTIRPGEKITISGDGSTEKEILIYLTDGDSSSNDKYLVGKVDTDFGYWKWEGSIPGRNIRTLDGKLVTLQKDRYYFTVPTVSEGGMLDLSTTDK